MIVPAGPAAQVAYQAPVTKLVYAEPEGPVQYQYEYSVQDPNSGDDKQQKETRNGDAVQGFYTVVQPDGLRRIVEYTSSKEHGFNAVVRYEGQAIQHVKQVAYAPAPVAKVAYAAAPVSYAQAPAQVAYAAPVAKVAYAPTQVAYAQAPVAKVAYAPAPVYAQAPAQVHYAPAPVAKVAYPAQVAYAQAPAQVHYAQPQARVAYAPAQAQVAYAPAQAHLAYAPAQAQVAYASAPVAYAPAQVTKAVYAQAPAGHVTYSSPAVHYKH